VAGGPIGKEIEAEIIEKGGFRPIAYFIRGPRNLTSNRPIRTPADAKGLIVRVPNSPLYVAFWEALGATPTPMAFSEVFTSLQQGTIHAQENPLALIYSAGFYEVQKYVNVTEHLRTWIYVVIGEEKFKQMPADLQKIIIEAGQDMQKYEHELFLADEKRLAQELQARGMTFITDVDQEAFTKAGQPGILRTLTPEQRELWDRIVAVK
jgi:tripartite ATP-independent transporter DctP family solute receptor